ncbi:sialidase family protein [Lentibacillus sp. CBA3610]|uniref:WD40/YVTN/BNR-like repeat-containing protein n=1 Tax=Lentibacillus sp. CBA3610 TaxID=2518176 RepID=UPI001595C67B|nr:sialidase family protein [Lentibacillus sp. CBA3610]QKY70770.1 exo-alpha-sialidase [Lentibacillus sp. CBA3610]
MLSKKRTVTAVILLLLILAAASVIYYYFYYEENLNKPLPMTVTVDAEDNQEPEDIAYSFWFDYMNQYQGDDVGSWKRLTDARYNDFQLLAGEEQEFAVEATFWVQLEKGNWSTHHSWGDVQEDGTVENIQWTFRIKQTGENEYTLLRIDDISHAVGDLPPVEDTYQKEAGIEVPDENNRYRIRNGTLEVTYDNGANWTEVPVEVDELFEGDYNGPQDELIEDSYVITPERTAFVVGGHQSVKVLQSTDQGETWESSSVPSRFQAVRMRILDFVSESDGFLILTGGRTMSWEGNRIFKTDDGGATWEEVGSVPTERQVTSAGFIDDALGFVSFGSITRNDNPPVPDLYRTADGGESWTQVDVSIPAEYEGIFRVAETPTFDGSQGTLLVNQGPNGDYQGGNVKARFVSVDDGETWSFANLVDPDDVIER